MLRFLTSIWSPPPRASLSKAFDDSWKLAIIRELVSNKVKQSGVSLTSKELTDIAMQIRQGRARLRFRRWQFWDKTKLEIEFTAKDLAWLTDVVNEQFYEDLCIDVAQATSPAVLAALESGWISYWKGQRRRQLGFERRLNRVWAKPLDLMRMLLAITMECAETAIPKIAQDCSETPVLADVLVLLHARSCQIYSEILTLLESGFADGAMARWRSLHEVSVIGAFIALHGEEIAIRYVDHEVVETYHAAKEYWDMQKALDAETISREYLKELKREAARLEALHGGTKFSKQYGWAAKYLNADPPTLAAMEQELGLEYLRPSYRVANYNVHGSAKGAFWRLGLLGDSEKLLAGASNVGLQQPGALAAEALAQSTNTLLSLIPDFEALVAFDVMAKLVARIRPALEAVAEDIELAERESAPPQ